MQIRTDTRVSGSKADTHQIHSQIHSDTCTPRGRVHVAPASQVTRAILTKRRISLSSAEAMHLQLRLQSAGWSADVQRWESDEDSEDSEGECAEDEKVGGLSEAQILRLMA